MNNPNFPNESDLIHKIQSGTPEEAEVAFRELFWRHSSHLFFYLQSKGLTGSEQQEVAHETWCRTVKKLQKFEYRGVDLFPWLRKTADFVTLERFRAKFKLANREEPLGEENHFEAASVVRDAKQQVLNSLTREEIRKAIWEILQEAPEDYRSLINAKFSMDLTPKQIAAFYKWSMPKFYTTTNRALQWLKKRFLARFGSEIIKDWLA